MYGDCVDPNERRQENVQQAIFKSQSEAYRLCGENIEIEIKKIKRRRKINERKKSEILQVYQIDKKYCKDKLCSSSKISKNPKFFIFKADFAQETDEMKYNGVYKITKSQQGFSTLYPIYR